MKMQYSLFLGRIAGIKLYIHWTFVILIAWILLMNFRAGNTLVDGLWGVLFVLTIFLCVTLHEYGHALTARRFNIPTKNITLLPIGGLAQLEKMPNKPGEELKVAIAGPMVNVVIASGLYIILSLTQQLNIPEEMTKIDSSNFLLNLFMANLILAVFNLVPAFPMDGGRVLRALLSFTYDRGKATRIAATIGQILAIMFVFSGFFTNFWLIFIGVFIYLGAGAESAFESTKSALTGHQVKDVLMKRFPVMNPGDTLEKAVKMLLDGPEHEFIITEDQKVVGILTRNDLIKGLSEFGAQSPVSNIMRKDFITLNPTMALQEVYQNMMIKGYTVLPVVQADDFVGIIDKENIQELLMVKQALNGG